MMEETEEGRRAGAARALLSAPSPSEFFHFSEGDRRRKAGAPRALLAAPAPSEKIPLEALHHGMINDDPIDVVLPARTDETTGNVNKVNEHDEFLPTNRKNFPSRPGCARKRSDRSSTTSHSDLSTEGTEPRQSCEGQEAPPWTDLEKRAHEGSRKLSCQGAQRDFPSRTGRTQTEDGPGCARKRSDRPSTTSHSDLSTEGTEPRQSCEGQEAPPWTDLEKRAHEGSRKLSCQGAQRDFPSRTGRTQTEDGPGCARKRSDDLRRRYSKSPMARLSSGMPGSRGPPCSRSC